MHVLTCVCMCPSQQAAVPVGHNEKKQHVLMEMLETEKSFVSVLLIIAEVG